MFNVYIVAKTIHKHLLARQHFSRMPKKLIIFQEIILFNHGILRHKTVKIEEKKWQPKVNKTK